MSSVTFKGTPVTIKGTFPTVGQKAPDFCLVDGDLQEKTLKDFPMRKLLVIVPSLDTDVCAISSKKFSEQVLAEKDLSLLIISADLPFAQKRCCLAKEITGATTLSMMRDKSFAESYGVLIQDGPLAGLCSRAVILLDKDNTILYAELVPEITQEPTYSAVFSKK